MAHLITQGTHRFELTDGRMTLGTDAGADIPVQPGFDVAPRHIALQGTRGGHDLRALSRSSSSTTVNGVEVTDAVGLEHGDLVRVGSLEFFYENETTHFALSDRDQVPIDVSDSAAMDERLATTGPGERSRSEAIVERRTKRDNFLARRVLPAIAIIGSVLVAWSEADVANRHAFEKAFPNATPQELRFMKGVYDIAKGSPGYRTPEEVFPLFNFSYLTPEEPWRSVPDYLFPNDPYDFNNVSVGPKLGYVHAKSHQLFVISAAISRNRNDYKTVLANELHILKSSDPTAVQKSYREVDLHGRRYHSATYESTGIGRVTHLWLHVGKRHIHQMVLTSTKEHSDGMATQGAALLEGFAVLN